MVSFILQALVVLFCFVAGFYGGVVGASKDKEEQKMSFAVFVFFVALAALVLITKAFT